MKNILDLQVKINSHLGYLYDYIEDIIDYYKENEDELTEEDIIFNLTDMRNLLRVLERDIQWLVIEYDSKVDKY